MKRLVSSIQKNAQMLVLGVIVFSIAITLAVIIIRYGVQQLRGTALNRLELQISHITDELIDRHDGGEAVLHALSGFFAGSETVTRDEFHDFISNALFFEHYPEFSVLAYIERVSHADKEAFVSHMRLDTGGEAEWLFTITPDGTRDEYWPITFISSKENVAFLLGQDQHAEPIREQNITTARDSGDDSLSHIVSLGQGGLGALIAVPLYDGRVVPSSIEQRRAMFRGAVTASFSIDTLFNRILPFDVLEQASTSIVFRSGDDEIPLYTAAIPNDLLTTLYGVVEKTAEIEIGQRPITLTFTTPIRSLLSTNEALAPLLIAALMIAAAFVVLLIIVAVQKAKLVTDLRKRYGFISMLSHQLRTPVANLRWELASKKSSKKEQDAPGSAMSNIVAINSIISRMLLYIEIMEKNLQLEKNVVPVEDVLASTLEYLSSPQSRSRVKRVGKSPVKKVLYVDANKIVQALSFIIENALTYSPEDSDVTIDVRVRDSFVDISITDTGYGIPATEQKNIFTEFFRASNASLGINFGSGVSVFIANTMVTAHGGSIQYTSTEGEGSTFTVSLPVHHKE